MVIIPKSIQVGACKIYPPLTKADIWLTRYEPDEDRKSHYHIGTFRSEFEARRQAKKYMSTVNHGTKK